MIINDIDISPLLRARTKFEEFRQDVSTEKDRTAAIHAFEFCFELSWKTMKKLLESESVFIISPRDAIRTAGLKGFIHDPEVWFQFLIQRNKASHLYSEEIADHIVNILPLFSKELTQFISAIEGQKDL